MQHLDEGTIHAWLDGALSLDETRGVEQHVAACTDCSAAVAEARGLIAASARIVSRLDAVPAKVIPPQSASPKPRSFAPWGTLIAAGLILAVMARQQMQRSPAETQSEVAADMSMPAPPPTVPAADEGTPRRALQVPQTQQRVANSAAQSAVATAPGAGALTTQPIPEPTKLAASAPAAAPPSVARVDSATRDVTELAKTAAPRTASVGAATGFAAGAGNDTRQRSMDARAESQAAASLRESFAECRFYELDGATDILPARFALTGRGDRASVRSVSPAGSPSAALAELRFNSAGDSTVIRRGDLVVITLKASGSAVTGSSASGPRTGRVSPCR